MGVTPARDHIDGVGRGPEQVTLLERFIGSLRLPYILGAFLVTAAIGTLGQFVARLLDTGDFAQTVAVLFHVPLGSVVLVPNLVGEALWSVVIFYVLCIIRYMRQRLITTEAELLAVLPGGEASIHRVFGQVSRLGPAVLVGLLVHLLPNLPTLAALPAQRLGLATWIFQIGSTIALVLLFGTAVWMYWSALRGLYELGREPLQLRPYYEDGMLGLRPFGSLSLSFAFAYLVGVALGALASLFAPDPIFRAPQYIALISGFVGVGLVAFFLPLTGVHRRMSQERKRVQAWLRQEYVGLVAPDHAVRPPATLGEVRDLLALEMADRKVAAIAAWPFDTRLLGRLAAVMATVVAIIIARLLQLAAQL